MAWQKKWISNEEKSEDPKKAAGRATWYLSQRDHCSEELYQKLCRYFTEEAAAYAVAKMIEYAYLDDEKYARNKAQSLLNAHKSRREIQRVLREKGVDAHLITETLDAIYEDAAEDGVDPDVEAAMTLITRRYARKLAEGRKDLVVAALMRRGFSYAVIRAALLQVQEMACE